MIIIAYLLAAVALGAVAGVSPTHTYAQAPELQIAPELQQAWDALTPEARAYISEYATAIEVADLPTLVLGRIITAQHTVILVDRDTAASAARAQVTMIHEAAHQHYIVESEWTETGTELQANTIAVHYSAGLSRETNDFAYQSWWINFHNERPGCSVGLVVWPPAEAGYVATCGAAKIRIDGKTRPEIGGLPH